jgi:hypothetical protein
VEFQQIDADIRQLQQQAEALARSLKQQAPEPVELDPLHQAQQRVAALNRELRPRVVIDTDAVTEQIQEVWQGVVRLRHELQDLLDPKPGAPAAAPASTPPPSGP